MKGRAFLCVLVAMATPACTSSPGDGGATGDIGHGSEDQASTAPSDIRGELCPETSMSELPEAEGNCHYDCSGGFACKDGQMIPDFCGPIPCWVGISTCEMEESAWPCVSGECGPVELCADDIKYLETLVSDDVEWHGGRVKLLRENPDYSVTSCTNQVCIWRLLDDEGVELLYFRTTSLPSEETTAAEGTTNLSTIDITLMGDLDLSFTGASGLHDQVVLTWASLREHVNMMGSGGLKMGYSGALSVETTTGERTTFVWIRDVSLGTPFRIAVEVVNTEGECIPPLPYLHDGACVECLTSAHCGPGEICNQATWACETPDMCDLECCYCQEPYPACVQSWGVWMCIECPDDLACGPGGTCDPVTFTCSGTFPEDPWCPGCATDEDCWEPGNDFDLVCDPTSGCCFDRIGRCDNIGAMCIGEAGSGCVGLHAVSTGPPPADPTQAAACTCSTPWSGDLSACWPDGCPDDGCLGATVCASAELATTAGLPLAYEGGLCLDIHLFVSEPEPDSGSSE